VAKGEKEEEEEEEKRMGGDSTSNSKKMIFLFSSLVGCHPPRSFFALRRRSESGLFSQRSSAV
jgi:hypothetical protein